MGGTEFWNETKEKIRDNHVVCGKCRIYFTKPNIMKHIAYCHPEWNKQLKENRFKLISEDRT